MRKSSSCGMRAKGNSGHHKRTVIIPARTTERNEEPKLEGPKTQTNVVCFFQINFLVCLNSILLPASVSDVDTAPQWF